MGRKKKDENAAESGNATGQPGEQAPKRTIDERVVVLRVADKINALDADGKAALIATLNAADPDPLKEAARIETLAERHKIVAEALARASKLSPSGLAMLKKLVS